MLNDLKLSFLVKFLIFERCNRLTNEMAAFPVNSPERQKLQDEYAPVLGFANQAQITHEKAVLDYLSVWKEVLGTDQKRRLNMISRLIGHLDSLELPFADSPIYTVVDGDIVPLSVQTVAEWLVDELQRQKEPDVIS